MLQETHKILLVSVAPNCSAQEFFAAHDPLVASNNSIEVHQWCLLTNEPPAPALDSQFQYAYIAAHGDLAGCSFCVDEQCFSKQSVIDEICEFLADDALVVGSCCWCGTDDSAVQIACACADQISEIVGPIDEITNEVMRSRAQTFFRSLGDGLSHVQAAHVAGLQHHFVADLELSECEP